CARGSVVATDYW
nr:immunoglobulin heavy chain junction region [Mus musculus]